MKKDIGFTLIELLVVVLIIGILAAVALPRYQKAVDKAKFMQAIVMHKAVWDAQKVYYLANGSYAVKWGELSGVDLPVQASGGGDNDSYIHWSWGYCMLSPGTAGAYGMCGVNYPGGPARVMSYWGARSRNCYAAKNSPRAQRVCEAVTGKNSSQGHLNGNDYIYSF